MLCALKRLEKSCSPILSVEPWVTPWRYQRFEGMRRRKCNLNSADLFSRVSSSHIVGFWNMEMSNPSFLWSDLLPFSYECGSNFENICPPCRHFLNFAPKPMWLLFQNVSDIPEYGSPWQIIRWITSSSRCQYILSWVSYALNLEIRSSLLSSFRY